jgi:imidazole glycerol-phosphate synthase subunit HisF
MFVNGTAEVVKGKKFKELKIMGNPVELAKQYYEQGADELCFLDITASKESRSTMLETLAKVSEEVFIPITAGGGVKSLDEAKAIFRAGADKVTINTAALNQPKLIQEISQAYGTQACVVAIDAKKQTNGWAVFSYGGTQNTGQDVVTWAKKAKKLGAGELLITSMDRDGMRSGYDLELLKTVSEAVHIPIIASGGAGNIDDILKAVKVGKADAVLAASIFHFKKYKVRDVKRALKENGISVRL